MLPKIYCINVKEHTLRRQLTTENWAAAGITDIVWWNAFPGQRMGVSTRIPHRGPDNLPDYLSQNYCGLTLSYLSLWQHLLHCPWDETLIIEDDAFVQPNFKEEFQKSYRELPDSYDLAFVGHLKPDTEPFEQISSRIAKIPTVHGTHAILYRKKVLEMAFEKNLYLWHPIDSQIRFLLLPHVESYCFYPSLVEQHSQKKEPELRWGQVIHDQVYEYSQDFPFSSIIGKARDGVKDIT